MSSEVDLTLDQFSDFKAYLYAIDSEENPVDLTDYTLTCQFRPSYSSNVEYTITTNIENALEGIFSLNLLANTSEDIPAGRYVYDILAIDNVGNQQRVLEGILTLTPEVTFT